MLYWVDIIEKKIHVYQPDTGENKSISLDQQVGAVVPRKSGGAILAMQNGFYALNFNTEKTELIYDPESHLPDNRFNDGKCDPHGRFWAGTMNSLGLRKKGALYCLDTNMSVTKKLNCLSISNGLAWSPDHVYMYHIDTPAKKVVRYEYDLTTGHVQKPRVIITFNEGEGVPDGMTIDEEGMLWIAHWGGSKISRWNPKTGKQLTAVSIPALNVTSCTFGGPDLTDLYITTARTQTNNEDLVMFPHAGGVFKLKTQVKGSPTFSFKG
jgi:sugar lactone lactonase YvrE